MFVFWPLRFMEPTASPIWFMKTCCCFNLNNLFSYVFYMRLTLIITQDSALPGTSTVLIWVVIHRICQCLEKDSLETQALFYFTPWLDILQLQGMLHLAMPYNWLSSGVKRWRWTQHQKVSEALNNDDTVGRCIYS